MRRDLPIDLTTIGGDGPLPPPYHPIYNFFDPVELATPIEYDPIRFMELERRVAELQRTIQHVLQLLQMKGKSDGG